MTRQPTTDHTIIVRVWVETHDVRPRARLVHIPSGTATTALGIIQIEAAFSAILRSVLSTIKEDVTEQ